MPVEMSKSQAMDLVRSVAQQSYGSGLLEKDSGGYGSVGMIGGKPVKFNTHWKERRAEVTPEMVQSSNELRLALAAAAKALAGAGQEARLKAVYSKLGLNAQGELNGNKDLLSRKVAAQVLKAIDAMRHKGGVERTSLFDGTLYGKLQASSSAGIDTSFAAQSGEPRAEREGVLAAVRKEFGKDIPKKLKEKLEAAGVNFKGPHSAEPIDAKAFAAVFEAFGEAKAERSKQAESASLYGTGMVCAEKRDTMYAISEGFVKYSKNFLLETRSVEVGNLVTRLVESGADPVKTARLAYLLTDGLPLAAEKYWFLKGGFDGSKVNPEKIPKPVNPEPGPDSFGLKKFMWDRTSDIEKAKQIADYKKAEAEYRVKYEKACLEYDPRYVYTEQVIAKVLGECGTIPKDANAFIDKLMKTARDHSNEMAPGIFDATTGRGLAELDIRLNNINTAEHLNAAAQETGKRPATMLKVDVPTVLAKMQNILKEKLSAFAEFKDLRLVPDGKTGSFTLDIAELKFNSNVVSNALGDLLGPVVASLAGQSRLQVPVKLGFDPDTGAVKLSVGNLRSGPDSEMGFANSKVRQLKGIIYNKLKAGLGGVATVEGNAEARDSGRIKQLYGKGAAPIHVEIDPPDGGLLDITISPDRFAPLQSLGISPGTKLTDLRIENGELKVQVGGKKGDLEALSRGQAAAAAQVQIGKGQLNVLRDKVLSAMAAKDIKVKDLDISTVGQDGTVRVVLTELDATEALKDVKGAKKLLRLVQEGSYTLSFKPRLDPNTHEILFGLQGVQSDTNVGTKRLVNAGMRLVGFIAKIAFSGNPDLSVNLPLRSLRGPSTLVDIRLKPTGLVKMMPQLDRGDGLPSVDASKLEVSDDGITLGLAADLW